jgi:hypothetical protein
MKNETKTTRLVVSTGQYEQAATIIEVRHTTQSGLLRRAKQLSQEYASFGDNFAGWIPARVAIASEDDQWGDNDIIGGRWCDPANGWLDV